MPFLAIMVIILWTRFLLMLQLTRTFGPMLRILLNMAGDVLRFLVIQSVLLIMVTSVAALLFSDLETYTEFFDVIFIMFGTGMGNYDLDVFSQLSFDPVLGKFFILLTLILNNIILINFVIAIQADTYSKLSDESLGIYYDGIIARIPIYEDDERYGGLIVGTPPSSLFAIFMIPFYWFVKDEKKLKRINDYFTKGMFLPVSIIITLGFMAINILLLPFAYVVAIKKKIQLVRSKTYHAKVVPTSSPAIQKMATEQVYEKTFENGSCTDLLCFIIMGIPMLLCAQLRDVASFVSL